ncbi:hypothetical protein [Achromobacter piechaudii]|uniref:DNA translocase FtsK 4TM region domain-containing protein n=1 Tax=Achromobacter piechaudii TaxID=72556 RepID=A0ABN7EV63_9BURK|nr:hypothetical protein [Achromobacter piechaudii]CAB3671748.1 hypothetical protein LMG1873_01155 [Achromobacter piechaudii]CAB3836441.1 hypothetical protein LMG2828_01246 [Achromobacter piechaudii]CAB3943144.1 hypothetical protein LMG6103_00549 [Achromobacter piechaudii]
MQGKELRDVLTQARTHGGRWAATAAARVNRGDAVGALLFLLATTVFSVLTMRMMGSNASLSFYDLLRLQNGGGMQGSMGGQSTGAGIYALLWLLAVVGPLLPSLMPQRAARLGYFLPLALWLIALMGVISQVRELMEATRQFAGFMGNSRASRNMAGDMASSIWSSLSFGFGFYLSLAIVVGFAIRGVAMLRRPA